MKNLMRGRTTFRNWLCLALLLSAMLSNPALAQDPKSWTTVGSAGTVNDEDTAEVELAGGGIARLDNAAPANTSAIIRYNVVAVDGLFTVGFPKMRVRYQDNGANAQVIVRLMEYDFTNNTAPNLVMEFDSNDHASSPSLQTRSLTSCGFGFNFTNKAYYIEAQLIRTAATGFPMLAVIQLSNAPANCVP